MARPMRTREDRRVSGFGGDVGGEERSEPGTLDSQSIQGGARVIGIAITRKMVGPEGVGDDQQDPQLVTPGAWCEILPCPERPGPS
jgi:hypothetical protein